MSLTTSAPSQSTRAAVLSRMARALESAHLYTFIAIRGRGFHLVTGGSADYQVCNSTCTCPDYLRNRMPCKHLLLLASGLAQVRQETDEEFSARAQRESQGLEWVRRQLAEWEQFEAPGRAAQIAKGRRHISEDFPAND